MVSVWTLRLLNPLLHAQFGLEAEVGIEHGYRRLAQQPLTTSRPRQTVQERKLLKLLHLWTYLEQPLIKNQANSGGRQPADAYNREPKRTPLVPVLVPVSATPALATATPESAKRSFAPASEERTRRPEGSRRHIRVFAYSRVRRMEHKTK